MDNQTETIEDLDMGECFQSLQQFRESKGYLYLFSEVDILYGGLWNEANDPESTDNQRVHKLEQMRGLSSVRPLIDGLIQNLQENIKNNEEREDD